MFARRMWFGAQHVKGRRRAAGLGPVAIVLLMLAVGALGRTPRAARQAVTPEVYYPVFTYFSCGQEALVRMERDEDYDCPVDGSVASDGRLQRWSAMIRAVRADGTAIDFATTGVSVDGRINGEVPTAGQKVCQYEALGMVGWDGDGGMCVHTRPSSEQGVTCIFSDDSMATHGFESESLCMQCGPQLSYQSRTLDFSGGSQYSMLISVAHTVRVACLPGSLLTNDTVRLKSVLVPNRFKSNSLDGYDVQGFHHNNVVEGVSEAGIDVAWLSQTPQMRRCHRTSMPYEEPASARTDPDIDVAGYTKNTLARTIARPIESINALAPKAAIAQMGGAIHFYPRFCTLYGETVTVAIPDGYGFADKTLLIRIPPTFENTRSKLVHLVYQLDSTKETFEAAAIELETALNDDELWSHGDVTDTPVAHIVLVGVPAAPPSATTAALFANLAANWTDDIETWLKIGERLADMNEYQRIFELSPFWSDDDTDVLNTNFKLDDAELTDYNHYGPKIPSSLSGRPNGKHLGIYLPRRVDPGIAAALGVSFNYFDKLVHSRTLIGAGIAGSASIYALLNRMGCGAIDGAIAIDASLYFGYASLISFKMAEDIIYSTSDYIHYINTATSTPFQSYTRPMFSHLNLHDAGISDDMAVSAKLIRFVARTTPDSYSAAGRLICGVTCAATINARLIAAFNVSTAQLADPSLPRLRTHFFGEWDSLFSAAILRWLRKPNAPLIPVSL